VAGNDFTARRLPVIATSFTAQRSLKRRLPRMTEDASMVETSIERRHVAARLARH
jgi:hypothetical protein